MSEIEEIRGPILKAAFGEGPAKEVDSWLDELQKLNYDAYAHKINLLAPHFDALSKIASTIPKFWLNSLTNCRATAPFVDPVDRECLSYLKDVKITHKESDVRDITIEFHFSGKNPFFTNPTLSLSYTAQPPNETEGPAPPKYFLEADLYSLPATEPIAWTSKDHDLTVKAPRAENPEEFDEDVGMGSFFNLWKKSGSEGEGGIGEVFLEWWSHSVEFAANLPTFDDDSDDEDEHDHADCDSHDEDDEDSDEDPTKEIDLESEEDRPKKRGRKN